MGAPDPHTEERDGGVPYHHTAAETVPPKVPQILSNVPSTVSAAPPAAYPTTGEGDNELQGGNWSGGAASHMSEVLLK